MKYIKVRESFALSQKPYKAIAQHDSDYALSLKEFFLLKEQQRKEKNIIYPFLIFHFMLLSHAMKQLQLLPSQEQMYTWQLINVDSLFLFFFEFFYSFNLLFSAFYFEF